MSRADEIFIENCTDIMTNGYSDVNEEVRPHWKNGEPAHAIHKFGIVNRYDLEKEFPLMTLRRTFYHSAIEEMLWIYQKKSNRVSDLSTHIWDAWARPDGTIGKAYGYQMGIKHHYPEGDFDQVDKALYDLKNNPSSRRILINSYNHSDLHDMALAPCAYSITFNVTHGKLNALLNQRSQDMLVANNWNVVQYAALVHAFAAESGLRPGELVHVIADAHIYSRHIPIVYRLIHLEPLKPPRLEFDKAPFYELTPENFDFPGYNYHEFTNKIDVAI